MINHLNIKLIVRFISRFKSWKRNKRNLNNFKDEFDQFVKLGGSRRFNFNWNDRLPKLHDNIDFTSFDSHYVYHPAWAARVLNEIAPEQHVDFSSSLHFCTMISAFVPTIFYDFRPAQLDLNGLECKSANLTSLEFSDNSLMSISCLHTIEHIGLGRYGDKLDPDGDIKAINELQRVGSDHILIVVPVGLPKIYFNAHRVYDPRDVVLLFSQCDLIHFSYVDDFGFFNLKTSVENAINQKYACGCFYFRKNKTQNI